MDGPPLRMDKLLSPSLRAIVGLCCLFAVSQRKMKNASAQPGFRSDQAALGTSARKCPMGADRLPAQIPPPRAISLMSRQFQPRLFVNT